MGLIVKPVYDDLVDVASIQAFLEDYKVLCRRHGCLVVSDGEAVEVVPNVALANEDDPWWVEETTKHRGWKL